MNSTSLKTKRQSKPLESCVENRVSSLKSYPASYRA